MKQLYAALFVVCLSGCIQVNVSDKEIAEQFEEYPLPDAVEDFYESVDLGLSVRWATCNVGAYSEGDFGDFFAWGETHAKSYFSWDNLKYCNNGDKYSFSKYNQTLSGSIDYKRVLDPDDDVATYNWGPFWRTPTLAEWAELYDYCSWNWTSRDGHKGYLIIGPNGNSIFLPATGYKDGVTADKVNSWGFYWSSTLYAPESDKANRIYFTKSNIFVGNTCRAGRMQGFAVRPVKVDEPIAMPVAEEETGNPILNFFSRLFSR